MAVVELVARNEPGDVIFYACDRCGRIYDPKPYASEHGKSPEEAHKLASELAERCYPCNYAPPEPSLVSPRGKPVDNLTYCFSGDGNRFYADWTEARDDGETVIYGATFHPFRLDLDTIIESLLEDHHESATESDLIALSDLAKAVEAFNLSQTSGSYSMNDSIHQVVRQDQTFAIIKPDALERDVGHLILADLQEAGFEIIDHLETTLSISESEFLYDEHREKAHFRDLVEYTASGPCLVLILQADDDDAPALLRKLIGQFGGHDLFCLRNRYGVDFRRNSIHGSENARAFSREMHLIRMARARMASPC